MAHPPLCCASCEDADRRRADTFCRITAPHRLVDQSTAVGDEPVPPDGLTAGILFSFFFFLLRIGRVDLFSDRCATCRREEGWAVGFSIECRL